MGLIDGLFSTVINQVENQADRWSREREAQNQRDFDMSLYERQRADAIEDRDFNSIGSLVEQYKAAGLNPDALAGSAVQASSLGSVAPPYGSSNMPDSLMRAQMLAGIIGEGVSGLSQLANTAMNYIGSKDKHRASAIELELRKLDMEPKKLAATYAQFENEVLGKPENNDRIISQLETKIANADTDEQLRGDKLYNEVILTALQTKSLRDNTMVEDENGLHYENKEYEDNFFSSLFKQDQREQNTFVAWSNRHIRERQQALDDFDDFVMNMQRQMSEEQLKQLKDATLSGEAQTGLYKAIDSLDIDDKWKSILMSACAVLLNKINVAPIHLQTVGNKK